MRRTLKIYRTAWTRFGNCPDSPLRALPLFDSKQESEAFPSFSFSRKHRGGRFWLHEGRKSRLFLRSRDNSVRETNAQPAPGNGAVQGGLGCYPNKQKQRFPATPGTAVSSLCGNKDTACYNGDTRFYIHFTIPLF